MKFDVVGLTDIGRLRKQNEDVIKEAETQNGYVCVLCDGMGGHVGGAIAAELAATTIVEILKQSYTDPRQALKTAIEEANAIIHTKASVEPNLKGMGTTCVVLLMTEDGLYYAHVGDSRLYVFAGDKLHLLTKDHSYVQTLVDSHKIQAFEAETHPRKNELMRCLGVHSAIEVDVCPSGLNPTEDALFLLCSDGLNNLLSDKIIENILAEKNLSLTQKAEKLVTNANDFGGTDNISVQLVSIKPENSTIVTETPVNQKTPFIEPPIEVQHNPQTVTNNTQKPNLMQLSSNQKIGLMIVTLISVVIVLVVGVVKKREKPEEDNFLANLMDTTQKAGLGDKIDNNIKENPIVISKDTNTKKEIKNEEPVKTEVEYEYKVQSGDVLNKIATKFNIKETQIKEWNPNAKKKGHPKFPNLNADAPLMLKVKAKHIVESGETIGKIAEKYYKNEAQKKLIFKANGLSEETVLKKGRMLVIPQE